MTSNECSDVAAQLDDHHVPETNGRIPVCHTCGARTDGPAGEHHVLQEGRRRGVKHAVVSMCIGGGMARGANTEAGHCPLAGPTRPLSGYPVTAVGLTFRSGTTTSKPRTVCR